MKKLIVIFLILLGINNVNTQTLPYQLNVAWDASPDGISYNCYLDGIIVTSVTTLTCTIPVNSLGAHSVSVTAVNTLFVPSESLPITMTFTLKQPGKVTNVRIK